MRMSRRMGLFGGDTRLLDFFQSIDADEVWRLSRDSSSAGSLVFDQGSSAFPTTPDFRIVFFAAGPSCTIGIYNSTNNTWKTCASVGSINITLSGTKLSAGNRYAGAFFMTYSSWAESDVDALLSRVSIAALGAHYGSSAEQTKLETSNHTSGTGSIYLTIFTESGSNNSRLNVSPRNNIFSPVLIAPPSSIIQSYVYDPEETGYVAATTSDGETNASGRSGGFYRLTLT